MNRERWQKVDRVFKSALELPAGERAAFVERACGGDEGLRAEVLSLIGHDRETGVLGRPVVEEAVRLLAEGVMREPARAGQTFGPYRVVSLLGAGGMGEAYLALHERTGRKVVLKLLHRGHAGDEQRVRRFRQEARGQDLDARTDIWSLGVVLYEMLTGRAPFAGEMMVDTLAAIIGKEPPPLACYIKGVPEALEWIVAKALTKDRDGRYQTAKEFLSDLNKPSGHAQQLLALARR